MISNKILTSGVTFLNEFFVSQLIDKCTTISLNKTAEVKAMLQAKWCLGTAYHVTSQGRH